MAALAQDFSDAPACNLPVLTSAEVARVAPFIPKRTLRFVQVFVETVEQELVEPMLRQPTFVEAAEILARNLPVVLAARRPALGMLIVDALKNPVLRAELESGIDFVREELRGADGELFQGETGGVLEEALALVLRSNHAVFRWLSPRWEQHLARLHYVPELETMATRVDTLLVATIFCARKTHRPPWFAELVVALRELARDHARLINRALFDLGQTTPLDFEIRRSLTPDEREAAINDTLVAFECPSPEPVCAFLKERPDVFEVLHEAVDALKHHFGDARRTLEFVSAGSWDDRHLAVRVVVPERSELTARRDSFENAWWNENAHHANGGLVIAVRLS